MFLMIHIISEIHETNWTILVGSSCVGSAAAMMSLNNPIGIIVNVIIGKMVNAAWTRQLRFGMYKSKCRIVLHPDNQDLGSMKVNAA